MNNKQELPKWDGLQLQEDGLIVENPVTNEEYYLNEEELSMYNYILACQTVIEQYNEGISWFKANNHEAYMALLN
jgi:hypothetical protein